MGTCSWLTVVGWADEHHGSGAKLTGIVQEALEVVQRGERVLAIIPDKTRDDNTDLLFPIADQF